MMKVIIFTIKFTLIVKFFLFLFLFFVHNNLSSQIQVEDAGKDLNQSELCDSTDLLSYSPEYKLIEGFKNKMLNGFCFAGRKKVKSMTFFVDNSYYYQFEIKSDRFGKDTIWSEPYQYYVMVDEEKKSSHFLKIGTSTFVSDEVRDRSVRYRFGEEGMDFGMGNPSFLIFLNPPAKINPGIRRKIVIETSCIAVLVNDCVVKQSKKIEFYQ
jgi:hypothetical protein